MEIQVKERLIGAAVLVALIVVLVPEMLSGSRQTAPQRADILPGAVNNSGAVRTYTIDLSAPETPAETPPRQAPQLPETPTPSTGAGGTPITPEEAKPEGNPAGSERTEAALPESPAASKLAVPPAAPVEEPPAESLSRTPLAAPAQQADRSAATVGKGWAVQLGSFANRVNAERLVKDLRGRGYKAFIAASGSGAKARYKVRVGPEEDRARATDLSQRLKHEGHQVAVVAHP